MNKNFIFTPAVSLGGAEKVALNISKNIPSATLISLFKIDGEILASDKVRYINNFPVPQNKLLKLLVVVLSIFKISILLLREKPDYVQTHVHFVSLLVGIASRITLKKFKIDSVVHGSVKCILSRSRIYYSLILFVYRNNHKTICVSTGMVEELKSLGVKNCQLIYNAIDVKNIHENNVKGHALGEIIQIGVVARLETIKSIDTVIRAIYLVDNVFLNIGGVGSQENNLKDLVYELGLENRVRFWGFVDNVESFYLKNDLIISSSLSETFSLTILESLLHYKPVISSNCEYGPLDIFSIDKASYYNLRSIIRVKEMGLIYKMADVESLVEAIEEMKVNYNIYKPTERTVSHLKSKFSFVRFIKQYEELLG